MFFSLRLCLCVCSVFAACCTRLMVRFGFHYDARRGSFRVFSSAPTALWVIRNHLQQAHPKHTIAVEGVALLISTSESISIICDPPIRAQQVASGCWSTAGAVQ